MEQKQKHNDTKELISDEGMNICRNCGIVVDHCQLMYGYIDFHENRYRIYVSNLSTTENIILRMSLISLVKFINLVIKIVRKHIKSLI